MKKKQLFCLMLVMVVLPVSLNAQKWKLRRYEASFSICTSQLYSDIGGSADANNWYGIKDIEILKTRPSFAFGARYLLSARSAVKLNLIYGFLASNDKNSRNADRNLSVVTTIFEPSVQFEYYPIPETERKTYSCPVSSGHKGLANDFGKINPYIFLGLGGMFIDPKLKRNDVPYPMVGFNKTGLVVPFGIGLKLAFNSKISFGFEFGRRFTTSDYIDGYSTALSKSNDLYDFGMFSVIYKIPTDRRGFPIVGKAKNYRR